MKYKVLAAILALTVITWAQTSNSNPAPNSQENPAAVEKSTCPCCDKMDSSASKDAASCCAHHHHDAKAKAGSCSGHDGKCCSSDSAKSCMKAHEGKAGCADCGKDKTAHSCGKECDKHCGKDCCSPKSEKTAGSCCHHAMQS